MAWYSILPENLTAVETWIARLFILLGILTICPWAVLVIFDLVFYILRVVAYEIPVVGGRVQGRRRPRAPSLTERPSGRRRAFSLRGEEADEGGTEPESTLDGVKKRQHQGEAEED